MNCGEEYPIMGFAMSGFFFLLCLLALSSSSPSFGDSSEQIVTNMSYVISAINLKPYDWRYIKGLSL